MTQLQTNTTYQQHGVVAPAIDVDSASWWQALAEKRFELPRCTTCGNFFFPPGPRCPGCGSDQVLLDRAPTGGRIYSWIVVHYPQDPAFTDDVPYTVVAVQLDAGPRLFGRLLSGGPARDLRVVAQAYPVTDTTLLGFDADPATST